MSAASYFATKPLPRRPNGRIDQIKLAAQAANKQTIVVTVSQRVKRRGDDSARQHEGVPETQARSALSAFRTSSATGSTL